MDKYCKICYVYSLGKVTTEKSDNNFCFRSNSVSAQDTEQNTIRMARPLSKTILIQLNTRLGEPWEFCGELSKALMRRKSAPVISLLRIRQVKSKVR